MKLSAADEDCRYLAAFGTRANGVGSRFGDLLKKLGVTLGSEVDLSDLVGAGWILPVLRVPLPKAAFEAWHDYPLTSMTGRENCPAVDRWALTLYAATTSTRYSVGGDFWLHPLDDDEWEVGWEARRHAIDPADPSLLPPSFQHARCNQEITPWLDYFAYWQALQVIEVVDAITCRFTAAQAEPPTEESLRLHVARAHAQARRVADKWSKRRDSFNRLSVVRTVFGAGANLEQLPDYTAALGKAAAHFGFDQQQLRGDLRDTLLVLWEDWSFGSQPRLQRYPEAAELLRQEVQYTVEAIRLLGGKVDFFDPYWFDGRQRNEWANLISALPLEREQARETFAEEAPLYLRDAADRLPAELSVGEHDLRQLLSKHWDNNRSLRRLVLAFHRLQCELRPQRLTAEEKTVRNAERIEQLLILALHAERVLSSMYRERTGQTVYPKVVQLYKDTLHHVLTKLKLARNDIAKTAIENADGLRKKRDQLHELDTQGLQFVKPGEIGSGSDAADVLAASFVNLAIFRNYAAHHDALDAEMIYPAESESTDHLGATALRSVLIAIVACLYVSGGTK